MVKVNLIGFDQFQKRLAEAPKKLVREVGREVQAAGEEYIRLVKKDAPKHMGQLAGSASVQKVDVLHVKAVVQKEYAPFVEFGTKGNYRAISGVDASQFKGTGSGDFEGFLKSITEWVKKKGMAAITSPTTGKRRTSKKVVDRVAWAIAMSIMKKGIKPHPFFYKQMGIVGPKYEQKIKDVLNRL